MKAKRTAVLLTVAMTLTGFGIGQATAHRGHTRTYKTAILCDTHMAEDSFAANHIRLVSYQPGAATVAVYKCKHNF